MMKKIDYALTNEGNRGLRIAVIISAVIAIILCIAVENHFYAIIALWTTLVLEVVDFVIAYSKAYIEEDDVDVD